MRKMIRQIMTCLLYTSSAEVNTKADATYNSKQMRVVIKNAAGAVSYTHLDVYKRQAYNTTGLRARAFYFHVPSECAA